MIQLGELTEAGILRNLFIRYYRHKIYVSLTLHRILGRQLR